jgi:hypothetical protein
MEAVDPSEMLVSIYETTAVTFENREKLENNEVKNCRSASFAVNFGKITKYHNLTNKRLLMSNYRLPALIQLILIYLGP